jgi:hypothetical protein
LTKKKIYERVSYKDWNTLLDYVKRLDNITVSRGSKPAIRRHPSGFEIIVGGGSGSNNIQQATVMATLDRGGDELEDGTLSPEVNKYMIRLGSLPTVAVGTAVTEGQGYEYDGEYYTASRTFTVTNASLPPNSTFWDEYEGTEAGVLHQTENLIHCSHWYQVGDTVMVVNCTRENGDSGWWIIGDCPVIEDSSGSGSLYWDQDDLRLKAVFK